MSETKNQPDSQEVRGHVLRTVLYGGGLTGCLIFIILGAALALGFWLDKQFSNGGHGYLVGAVILSVPITFVGIIWMSKWFSTLNQPPTTGEPETQKEIQQEDAERGTN